MNNAVLKCTKVLEPFSQGMGVYLTPDEVDYIRFVISEQQYQIVALKDHINTLQKENQEAITGIGQL